MYAKNIIAAGALLSLVAAVPMQNNRRDVVWVTSVQEEVVTVDVTTTVWIEPGETPPPNVKHQHGHHHHHTTHHKHTSHIKSTVTVPAASPSPPVETSPQSTYVAPSPSTYEAPPPASTPETTPTPAAPTTTEQAPPPATTWAQPSPTNNNNNGGGSAPSGSSYTGDLTYYTAGLGSCGVTNTDSDHIVALAAGMMSTALANSANPGNTNANPLCGKSITISWGGKTTTATIEDTCPGCEGGSLDLTPTLFEFFSPLGAGRLTGMEWWYN